MPVKDFNKPHNPNHETLEEKNYLQRTWQKYRKKGWWAIATLIILFPKGGLELALLAGAVTFAGSQVNKYTENHPYQLEGKVIEMKIDEKHHGTIKVCYENEQYKIESKNLNLVVQDTGKNTYPYKSLKQEIINTFEHITPGDSVNVNAYDGIFKDYATNVTKK